MRFSVVSSRGLPGRISLFGWSMQSELGKILALIGRHKGRYALGALCLGLTDICQLYSFRLVGQAIDALQLRHIGLAGLRHYVLGLLALACFAAIFRFGWRQCVFGGARLIERHLRERLFEHLQTLSTRFFLNAKIGELMAHATNDITAMRAVAGEGVMAGFDAPLMGIMAVGMMLGTVSWSLTLVACLPLLPLPYFTYRLGRLVRDRYIEVQASFATLSDRVQESVAGIRVIKGFARETEQFARFAIANNAYQDGTRRMLIYDSAIEPLINLVSGLSFALALAYGGYLALQGHITIGEYVSFNGFLAMLAWPMLGIGWAVNVMQRASASLSRLEVLFKQGPEVFDAAGALPLNAPVGHLQFKSLSFRYAPELPEALSNIELELLPGRTLGIVGGLGAGKSTLANLVLRLFNPPDGTVFFDGRDINALRLDDLRRAVAYVPQDAFLFSRSILENIAFDPQAHTLDEILEAAAIAKLDSAIEAFPYGYETLLGERGVTLSGGQRQRLAIARALVKDARLVILDDCLSAVDTLTESRILEGLKAYGEGRTLMIISHRLSALQHADEIVVLAQGLVVERGTHGVLLALNGEYARLYRLQQLEVAIERM
jgi:ATP-binding cassette subfamily B multidrug efflux pump